MKPEALEQNAVLTCPVTQHIQQKGKIKKKVTILENKTSIICNIFQILRRRSNGTNDQTDWVKIIEENKEFRMRTENVDYHWISD